MLFAVTFGLSLDLREATHSRLVSQNSFHYPVETITAPRAIAITDFEHLTQL